MHQEEALLFLLVLLERCPIIVSEFPRIARQGEIVPANNNALLSYLLALLLLFLFLLLTSCGLYHHVNAEWVVVELASSTASVGVFVTIRETQCM